MKREEREGERGGEREKEGDRETEEKEEERGNERREGEREEGRGREREREGRGNLLVVKPALPLRGAAVHALLANGASDTTHVFAETGLHVGRVLAGEVVMHHPRHSHRQCVGGDGVVFHRGLFVVFESNGGTSSIWEARQNEGFGLLSPVTNYYGQQYTGFGIFWFVLIIYYGQCAPMAVLSRKMAFGLPNFLVWIFAI